MANRFYRNTKIINKKYYSIPNFTSVDFSDISGKEFVVQYGDRLDIIAEQIYGNASFWKAIALYNDIEYFFDLQPGDIIKLPLNINKVLTRI